ncbi:MULTISPECIES: mycothiol transferase [unclassified Streptomyces]|uniref:mycothiol transferase n=1 Tax=unclassified Streptomyces TaxID=2593676 RepID=UPI0033EECFEF
MSASTDLLVDAFGRIREVVEEVVDGLDPEQLGTRPDGRANSIAWLVWHLTRVQDDHIAGVAGTEQVWSADEWYEAFGLPFPAQDIGYGHSRKDVAKVRGLSAELLTDYHAAVHEGTVRYLSTLAVKDLGRVVDRSWSPPVTLGVRLVSVVADDLQHAGQAAYVRGLLGG